MGNRRFFERRFHEEVVRARRYGGEEIAVPTSDVSGDAKVLRVTASAGVATLSADVEDFPELMRRCDAALYRAKKQGRNRAVADERDGPPGNEAAVPKR